MPADQPGADNAIHLQIAPETEGLPTGRSVPNAQPNPTGVAVIGVPLTNAACWDSIGRPAAPLRSGFNGQPERGLRA